MTEIFTNISDEVKQTAELIWKIALLQDTPDKAANFIKTSIDFLKSSYAEDQIDFIEFYIKMQMEKMKNE